MPVGSEPGKPAVIQLMLSQESKKSEWLSKKRQMQQRSSW
jgi:hypothetical protein